MPQPSPTATTSNEPQRRLLTELNPTQGAYYSAIDQTDAGATSSYHGLLLKTEHRFCQSFHLADELHLVALHQHLGFRRRTVPATTIRIPTTATPKRAIATSIAGTSSTTPWWPPARGFGTGILRGITKDWQIAPIISLNSGQPFSVTDGTDVSLTGEGSDRPNVVPGVASLPHTLAQWFNTAAFAGSCACLRMPPTPICETPGTFGNAGRDTLSRTRAPSSGT